jgi:hypothetical protein
MIIPEYGRHIQDLVNHATEIENKEERNEMVSAIIDVMGQLNPHLRDVSDFTHKLWDHVYIMSDFKLDIESPYPKPEPEHFQSKPRKMPYPEDKIRFKHYGKGVENLVGKAVEMEDGEEKEALILSIANLMKKHYLSWSRNAVDDRIIWLDLNKIARGKLSFDETTPLISTKEIATRNDVNGNTHSNKKGKKKKRKPYKKKKY